MLAGAFCRTNEQRKQDVKPMESNLQRQRYSGARIARRATRRSAECGDLPQQRRQGVCLAGSMSAQGRSEEHTSELQSLMRISYAVCSLKKQKHTTTHQKYESYT